VFIEVKARANHQYGQHFNAVTPTKSGNNLIRAEFSYEASIIEKTNKV
jgi:Holliday junction resolvase-like predicted endonuclease